MKHIWVVSNASHVFDVFATTFGTFLVSFFNKHFCRGGVGVEVLDIFWEELLLHFFWPTFWLHCIFYFTYRRGFAPRIDTVQNSVARKLAKRNGATILPRKLPELHPCPSSTKRFIDTVRHLHCIQSCRRRAGRGPTDRPARRRAFRVCCWDNICFDFFQTSLNFLDIQTW